MSTNNSSSPLAAIEESDEFIIPEEARIFLFTLILAVSFFGIVSNILNIIVFHKLQDGGPININLLGLAVSDLAVCLTTFVFFITTAYWLLEDIFMEFRINPVEVFYITIGVPNTIFARITVLLTALISLERCLCVVLPLKVKSILSKGRAKLSVALCFLVGLLVLIPNYYVSHLEWVFIPFLNTSIMRLVKTDDFYEMNYWFTPLEGFCLHIIPFLIVTVSTIIMIRNLKKRMAFRQSVVVVNANNVHFKEKKVAMMVVIMSVVFLVCNLPNIVVFLVSVYYPSEFSLDIAADSDLTKLLGLMSFFLNTFNSAINIFIYYTNSSKYQGMFKAIFGLRKN